MFETIIIGAWIIWALLTFLTLRLFAGFVLEARPRRGETTR